jgi:hypothetical protein
MFGYAMRTLHRTTGCREAPVDIDLHAGDQPFDELVAWALRELLEPGPPTAVLLSHDGTHVIRARSLPVEEWIH